MENEPLHIFIADDDEADRLLFKEAFNELKMKTIIYMVNDGMQLMQKLSNEDAPLPQLLFLDLNMPRKNGLECLKEIKSSKRLKDIFVAIYSTSSSEKDIELTFLNGANIYINKPNDFNVLKQILEKAVMAAHLYQEPPFNKDNFLLRM
jgi:CheY-like chemotaxis protein